MNIDLDIFKAKNNFIKPHRGCVLISDPFSQDLFFKRSVVFLAEYNNNGSVGFILNKSTEVLVKDVLDNFDDVNLTVSIGGPVNTNTVHFIHTLGNEIPNSVNVIDNIFWGGDFDIIKSLLEKGIVNNENIRFFIGYSGWKSQQLEKEIADNLWVVSNLNANDIINMRDSEIWKYSLEKFGDTYKSWINIPENPYLN